MYMKRNVDSSNCRSKTSMDVYVPRPLGWYSPRGLLILLQSARRAHLGIAGLLVGGQATTHASTLRTKSHARGYQTHKDVKYEDRSGNVYENKGP